jgi:hypothetical protein
VADFDETVTALRRWTKDHDPHVKAAVELLIWHERWLRSPAFVRACVETSAGTGETWIAWGKARDFERRSGAAASESERAVLRIAVALGSDDFRLSRMDDEQAGAVVRAFATALEAEAIGNG